MDDSIGGDFIGSESVDVSDVSVDIPDITDDISMEFTDIDTDALSDGIEALETFEGDELISDIPDDSSLDMAEFEERIEGMSLDELNAERDILIDMGVLDGEQLAREYDDFIQEQTTQEQFDAVADNLSIEQFESMQEQAFDENFDALTGNMNAEQLGILREQTIAGNQEVLDMFGVNKESDDSDEDQKILQR